MLQSVSDDCVLSESALYCRIMNSPEFSLPSESLGEIASEKQWCRKIPGLYRDLLTASSLEPVSVEQRGSQAVRYWSRAQIEQILREQQSRFRGGAFLDPITGTLAGTVGYWRRQFHWSHEYLERGLAAIGAVRHSAPDGAATDPDRTLVTSQAVSAALEQRRNEVSAATTVTPDPVRRTAVGSIEAWSKLLGVPVPSLGARIATAGLQPTLVLGRSSARVYTLEQLRQIWPAGFSQPELRARANGVLIPPCTEERYLTALGSKLGSRLRRANVAPLVAQSPEGARRSYYPEMAVAAQRQNAPAIEPVTPGEYLRVVALINPVQLTQRVLTTLRKQATFLQADVPRVLTADGTLVVGSRTLAPRATLLGWLRRENNPLRRQQLAAQLVAAEPVTLQDVSWPGHWEGMARLWLYDLTALDSPPPTEDERQLAEVRRIIAASEPTAVADSPGVATSVVPKSTELNVAQRRSLLKEKAQARLRNQRGEQRKREKRQQAERLAGLRKQFGRAFRRWHTHPEELPSAISALLEELSTLPVAPQDLGVGYLSDQFVLIVEREEFATPLAWEERFCKTFSGLTQSTLVRDVSEGILEYHETTNHVLVISERDILSTLLRILNQRQRR